MRKIGAGQRNDALETPAKTRTSMCSRTMGRSDPCLIGCIQEGQSMADAQRDLEASGMSEREKFCIHGASWQTALAPELEV
jgi:hypothetical protein